MVHAPTSIHLFRWARFRVRRGVSYVLKDTRLWVLSAIALPMKSLGVTQSRVRGMMSGEREQFANVAVFQVFDYNYNYSYMHNSL